MRELDLVTLLVDLPDSGLKAGDVGTVIQAHGDRGCEVEFMKANGETAAVVSVQNDQVQVADPATIPQAALTVPAA